MRPTLKGPTIIQLGGSPRAANAPGVLDDSKLPAGETSLIGHLCGGIRSSDEQVNGFNPSFASNTIYEVFGRRK